MSEKQGQKDKSNRWFAGSGDALRHYKVSVRMSMYVAVGLDVWYTHVQHICNDQDNA